MYLSVANETKKKKEKGGFVTDRSRSVIRLGAARPGPARPGVSSFVALYGSETNDVQDVRLRALRDHS